MHRLLNLSELSRALDVPYASLHRLVVSKRLIPDAASGRYSLFNQSGLASIGARLAQEMPDWSERIKKRLSDCNLSNGHSPQQKADTKQEISDKARSGVRELNAREREEVAQRTHQKAVRGARRNEFVSNYVTRERNNGSLAPDVELVAAANAVFEKEDKQ